MSAMLDRARLLWCTLAAAPVAFPRRGVAVVVAPESRLCPPGWCGVVTLGESAIATVPRDELKPVLLATRGRLPAGVAHVSVLTAPSHRGRGPARSVAASAVADALAAGRFPQWRARPPASRRVARALGFRELGSQLSFDLGSPA
jgi:hypothetical protein